MTDHGYVRLGKYDSARDDILHFMCTSDWANESTGNSVDWEGYAWRISNTTSEVNKQNTEVNSLLEDWFKSNAEVRDSVALRQELVGNFLVVELSNGMIDVASFDTPEALKEAYDAFEARYNEWASDEYGDDDDEYEPIYKVTNTGNLQQMEVHGVPTNMYEIEDVYVWAVNEATARAIVKAHKES